MPHPSSPPLLLLDFDDTLTTTSTLPLIASIATLPRLHPNLPRLSHAYAQQLQTHAQTYHPPREERRTIAQELAYLNSLRPLERASIERVEAEGLFRDVGAGDVDRAAVHVVADGVVRLRAGFGELCQRVLQAGGGGKVGIISVAWSRRFIQGVLSEHLRREGGNPIPVKDMDVRANEIAADGSGRLDRVFGADGGGIWTAGDKARVMDELIIIAETATTDRDGASSSAPPKTIYIGDSPTDLACLLRADVGICIRDDGEEMSGEQRELRATLERVGVECWHVDRFGDEPVVEDGGKKKKKKKKLWWAQDFEEVCRSGVAESLLYS